MQAIKTVKHHKIWGYEIWLYSPVPGQETTFANGTLNQGGPLVKIIHAKAPLSVQVHPDDALAQALENQPNGKAESWYVLQSEPEAELVMGLKSYDHTVIKQHIHDHTFEQLLNKVKPQVGDFFNIPAGLVHGIGAGLTLLEVQQPSDLTYRYYDYDRLENGQPRTLHLAQALQAQKDLVWNLKPVQNEPLTYQNQVGSQVFHNKPSVIPAQSIVVNLENYATFLVDANEKVDFNFYAVISFTS